MKNDNYRLFLNGVQLGSYETEYAMLKTLADVEGLYAGRGQQLARQWWHGGHDMKCYSA